MTCRTPLAPRRTTPIRLPIVLLLVLPLIMCQSGEHEKAGREATVGPERQPPPNLEQVLDEVEELTEDFANSMIDLAEELRSGDRDAVRMRLADDLRVLPPIRAALPDGSAAGGDPLVAYADWSYGDGVEVSQDVILRVVFEWLGEWSVVDDVRIKPGSFDLADADRSGGAEVRGGGELKLDVRGRDRLGRRQWLHGKARYEVAGRKGRWKISAVEFLQMELMVARREIFSEVGAAAGLGVLGTEPKQHRTEGLAAADVDNDGLVDIVAIRTVSDDEGVELYLNNGDGTFRDATAEVGLGEIACGGNASLLLDYDNDGDRDLFLCGACFSVHESRLAQEGKLRFVPTTERLGPPHSLRGGANGMAAADVNADGVPDIFCGIHGLEGKDDVGLTEVVVNGARDAPPHLLFVSQPDGTYREAAAEWGVADTTMVLGAHFADFNHDGRADLLVANDFLGGTDVYLHDTSRFVRVAPDTGLQRGADMGLSVGDFDRDGRLDVHVTRMSSTAGSRIIERLVRQGGPAVERLLPILEAMREGRAGCEIFRGLGDGRFEPLADGSGRYGGGWAWGGGFLDVDGDGWEDLWVPNGYVSGKRRADT